MSSAQGLQPVTHSSADTLTGSRGRDWFFANLDCGTLVTITDRHPSEFAD